MRNEELGEAPRGRLCGLGKREARRGRELRDSMPLHLLITYYKTVGAGLSRDPRKLTLFPRITPTTSQLSYRKIPHSSFFIPHWRPWAPTPLCAFVPLCLCAFSQFLIGGERGIRTPGTLRYNGFQDRRIRPLCHLSFWVGQECPLLSLCSWRSWREKRRAGEGRRISQRARRDAKGERRAGRANEE